MIQKKYIEFQMDLMEGLSLEEALNKYDLTFKDAVEVFTKSRSKKRKKKQLRSHKADKYIQRKGNRFYLRKSINGKSKLFGVYGSLEDAMKVRDYCIANGWHRQRIDAICEKVGVKRLKDHRCSVRYN